MRTQPAAPGRDVTVRAHRSEKKGGGNYPFGPTLWSPAETKPIHSPCGWQPTARVLLVLC